LAQLIYARFNYVQKYCSYNDYEYNNCGEKGHLFTVWKKDKKDKINNKSQNKLLSNSDSDGKTVKYDLSDTFFFIFHQNSKIRAVKPFIDLFVENKNLKSESRQNIESLLYCNLKFIKLLM